MKNFLKYIFSFLGILSFTFLLFEALSKRSPKKVVKDQLLEIQEPVKSGESNLESILKKYNHSLNERQMKILKMFKSREVLYPSDIYAILPNVSTRTIRRDLTALSNLEIIVQKGNTRDARYLLTIHSDEI